MTRPSSVCGRLSRNLLIVTFALSVLGLQVPARTDSSIPAAEFSRLIQQFSEDDGYFRSDNFTSNETSYLQVVDLFRKLDVSGGAYIGVGPEQNFTYIAKVRPRIAFIVDIRRQAMIQHLHLQSDLRIGRHARRVSRGTSQPAHRGRARATNRNLYGRSSGLLRAGPGTGGNLHRKPGPRPEDDPGPLPDPPFPARSGAPGLRLLVLQETRNRNLVSLRRTELVGIVRLSDAEGPDPPDGSQGSAR